MTSTTDIVKISPLQKFPLYGIFCNYNFHVYGEHVINAEPGTSIFVIPDEFTER